jgi:hypothetical protein
MTRLLERWRQADSVLPAFLPSYSAHEQARREEHLDRYLESVEAELHTAPRGRADKAGAEERLTIAFRLFAREALDFEDRHLDLLLAGGFTGTGRDFARAARLFDPSMSTADIYQATRNAWTTNGLQILLGLPARLTPAIFGYSMLYPCTDNYLDHPGVSQADKHTFNRRFGARLAGERIAPAGRHEAQAWALVSLIESQYRRSDHPEVFASLCAIQRAQERSLELHRAAGAGAGDVLEISFEKGGTSVLADAWLAAGTLSPVAAEFAFGWGVMLQLGDDLQDVAADTRDGIRTAFSEVAGHEPMDAATNRAFHFGARVLADLDGIGAAAPAAIKELIRTSFFMLLTRAAGEARQFYSAAYVRELERHSPFTFEFLRRRRRRFTRKRGILERLVGAFSAGDVQTEGVLATETWSHWHAGAIPQRGPFSDVGELPIGAENRSARAAECRSASGDPTTAARCCVSDRSPPRTSP